MSNILTEVNKAQTNQEAIEALRAQVAALTNQLADYDAVLSQYAEAANWQQNPISDTEQDRLWMLTQHGYTPAGEVLEKYATTAPTSTGA